MGRNMKVKNRRILLNAIDDMFTLCGYVVLSYINRVGGDRIRFTSENEIQF
jgi:hypothetical protein